MWMWQHFRFGLCAYIRCIIVRGKCRWGTRWRQRSWVDQYGKHNSLTEIKPSQELTSPISPWLPPSRLPPLKIKWPSSPLLQPSTPTLWTILHRSLFKHNLHYLQHIITFSLPHGQHNTDDSQGDEGTQNHVASTYAFFIITSALGIPFFLPFLKAICRSKKSWQACHHNVHPHPSRNNFWCPHGPNIKPWAHMQCLRWRPLHLFQLRLRCMWLFQTRLKPRMEIYLSPQLCLLPSPHPPTPLLLTPLNPLPLLKKQAWQYDTHAPGIIISPLAHPPQSIISNAIQLCTPSPSPPHLPHIPVSDERNLILSLFRWLLLRQQWCLFSYTCCPWVAIIH